MRGKKPSFQYKESKHDLDLEFYFRQHSVQRIQAGIAGVIVRNKKAGKEEAVESIQAPKPNPEANLETDPNRQARILGSATLTALKDSS